MPRENTLYPELSCLGFDELVQKFAGPPLDGAEYASAYYSEVAHLIREEGGAAAIEFLLKAAGSTHAPRAAAALDALTAPPAAATTAVRHLLMKQLRGPDSYVTMRAIDCLADLRDAKAREDILRLRAHSDPLVRGAVLRYIAALNEREGVAAAISALGDSSPRVREAAIDILDDLDAAEAAPLIQTFVDDPDPHVRQAAQGALNNLT